MADLAKIINFPDNEELTGSECVKADTRNGFTQVANELLDYLAKLDITKRQWRVMVSLIRKTYGFNKKTDWIVGEQIATHMEYPGAVTHIHADIRLLKSRNIIIKEGRKIGPNPVLSDWVLTQNQPKAVTAKTNRKWSPDKPETVTRQTGNGLNSDKKRSTQKKYTIPKDNIPKDSEVLNLPSWLSPVLWAEFVLMRKSIKKPLTQNAVKRMLTKLQKFQDSGINATEQLTRSIDNCYSDVYEPRNNRSPKKPSSAENFDNKDYGQTQIPEWMPGYQP